MLTVSVCMIVKNEERLLARVLGCAQRFADELVVVDTGSTDATVDIARRFTDKVYGFEWIGDFSAARNYAFEQASGDYLMWLDADDVIGDAQIEALCALKETIDPAVDVVMMPYNTGFDGEGNVTFSYYRERMVRREAGLRWQDPVHEFIAPAGRLLEVDIAIDHRPAADKPLSTRNIDIYEQVLARDGALNTRGTYYYARELKTHARFKAAAERFEQFLLCADAWVEDYICACAELADCYIALGDEERALGSLFRAFARDLPRAETLCRAGAVLQNRQDDRQAAFWYELALTLEKPTGWGFTKPECWDFIPHLQLCVIYDKLGKRELALEHHRAARALKPHDRAVLHNEAYFRQAADA